jgi:hypothetical protein
MMNVHTYWQASNQASNIRIELIDEQGNRCDPHHINEVDYLSRFQNKAVVNKVYSKMIADNRTGTIEVYQDKILIREN